jgi:hypothetical protein
LLHLSSTPPQAIEDEARMTAEQRDAAHRRLRNLERLILRAPPGAGLRRRASWSPSRLAHSLTVDSDTSSDSCYSSSEGEEEDAVIENEEGGKRAGERDSSPIAAGAGGTETLATPKTARRVSARKGGKNGTGRLSARKMTALRSSWNPGETERKLREREQLQQGAGAGAAGAAVAGGGIGAGGVAGADRLFGASSGRGSGLFNSPAPHKEGENLGDSLGTFQPRRRLRFPDILFLDIFLAPKVTSKVKALGASFGKSRSSNQSGASSSSLAAASAAAAAGASAHLPPPTPGHHHRNDSASHGGVSSSDEGRRL